MMEVSIIRVTWIEIKGRPFMDKFDMELKKVLMKRLPQSTEYGWSRRIEGALERSESSAPHEDVAIIVDSEIGVDVFTNISDKLYKFISKDEFFKKSHYRILLWKQDGLALISPKRISNASHVKNYLDAVEIGSGNSTDWNEFWQFYKPHKKAGQVFLITSQAKVERMSESKAIGIKNLVIVYEGDESSSVKKVIMSIPCIAYVSKASTG